MGEEKTVMIRNAFPSGRRSRASKSPSPCRLDTYRFSRLNMEEAPDVDLDEILGELGELDSQAALRPAGSPDNDSAFSDSLSLLSSSTASSSAVRTHQDKISRRLSSILLEGEKDNTTTTDIAARVKAEKIKIALEKIKEANVKKLFVRVYSGDLSSKSLLVDERSTVAHVCRMLADKNHIPLDIRWGLVEHCPDLLMERLYEDHEFLVENLLMWGPEMTNQLLFLRRDDRYDVFLNPEKYLLCGGEQIPTTLDEEAKLNLIEEFFCSSGALVPEVEGYLHLRSEGKKSWKKFYFVLRASGLYYCPKGRSKMSKDLLCLTTFEMNSVYIGINWKKKYKAPTDYGFAIKHPQIQNKASKYIKYLCAEDEMILSQWVTGIRIAKYGSQMKENYDALLRDLMEEDLDQLAHARSFSLSSMARALDVSPPGSPDATPRASSSESTPTPTADWRRRLSAASSSSGCPEDDPGGGLAEESLPPPAPELFGGSQESLPPPPSPLPINEECSWPSTSSLNSPPPPPEPLTPTNENQHFHRRSSESDVSTLEEFRPLAMSGMLIQNAVRRINNGVIHRLIVEEEEAEPIPLAPPPPPPPPPPPQFWGVASTTLPAHNRKVGPTPPKRSENTRLSEWTSKTLGHSHATPESFLKDLHQVMEKKWKVAQQLNADHSASPQQIFGFRDPGPDKKGPPPPPRRSEATQLSNT